MILRAIPLFASLLMLAPALAHAAVGLAGAAPSPDSVAQGAPGVVELTFSQPVAPKSCIIRVKGPDGTRVDRNDVHSVDDNTHMAVSVKQMMPGHYVVAWSATGTDRKHATGSYGFTVAP